MPHYLIAESELPDERAERRDRTGKSSGETYASTLSQLDSGAVVTVVSPADPDSPVYAPDDMRAFGAVFLTGSPMHVYEDSPEVKRQIAFMRTVFRSGVPSFGSCAGLQLAVAAAGGTVRKMPDRMEAGIARRIAPTDAGRHHPLLAGRPPCWDAAAIHGDEVATLPDGGVVLAGNAATPIQAAEIRSQGGVFWGVQYHPELSLEEIAIALRAQAAELVEAGLADEPGDVAARADLLAQLHARPDHRALRWALGVDGELADETGRRREIVNFLAAIPDLAHRD